MGGVVRRKSWRRAVAEKSDWRCFSRGGRRDLSLSHTSVLQRPNLEKAPRLDWAPDRLADRRTVAHPCYAAQPALFCVHAPQRTRPVSRFPLVFLHQRTTAAFSEFAIS